MLRKHTHAAKKNAAHAKRPATPRHTNAKKHFSTTPLSPDVYQKARKIVCVGRNFADHAKELGNEVPTDPVLFLKPPSSIILENSANNKIEIPPNCTNLHHEVELGLIIGKGGRDIPLAAAMDHVKGYFLGLDMTARELQNAAKAKGLPWSIAKGYDTFAPVSTPIEKSAIPDTSKLRIWLTVDGKVKQDGLTNMMLFPVPELVSHISTIFSLEENDLIFTGTPAGVGPVVDGSVIKCGLVNTTDESTVSTIEFHVTTRQPTANL